MMTGKNDDAARAREDSFLGELIPQVTEHLAAQHSGEFDAEAGRTRFMTWLAAHTKEPDALAKSRAGAGYVRPGAIGWSKQEPDKEIGNVGESHPHALTRVRTAHWLPRISLAFCGILIVALAAVALVAAPTSPVIVISVGTLLGVLVGRALSVHHLRAGITADIGPRLERMQNQLDLIESAVDIALAKWYDALRHHPPRPPEVPQASGSRRQDDIPRDTSPPDWGVGDSDGTLPPFYLDPMTKLFLVALIWCRPWLLHPIATRPLPRTPEIARSALEVTGAYHELEQFDRDPEYRDRLSARVAEHIKVLRRKIADRGLAPMGVRLSDEMAVRILIEHGIITLDDLSRLDEPVWRSHQEDLWTSRPSAT
jgi:hypothetical protein